MIMMLLLSVAVAFAQGTGTIKDIVIQGNQNVSREAILTNMRTKVGQPYIQANLDQDKDAVTAMGFFQAVDVRAEAVENDWRVLVIVSEYPIIKEIRVTGNKAVKTEDILAAISLKPGDVYNLRARNPSSAAIEALYKKKGFFALVSDFSPLAESPGTLNVAVTEMVVNSVKIIGPERTKQSVIKRLIRTKPGEPFDLQKWQNDLRRLYGTQWFESVESVDQPLADPGKIDLVGKVKETKTGTFNVGLQVDPRSTLAGFVKVEDPNFRGTGQNVGISLLQSTQGGGTSVDLNYGNPFMDSRDTSMSVSLYSHIVYRFTGTGFGSSSTPTADNRYFERRTGGNIAFSRAMNDYTFVSIGTRLERVSTSDIQSTNNNDFIKQDGNLSTITLGLTENRRDVDIDPAKGYWAQVTVEPGFANITEAGGAVGQTLLGHSTYVKTSGEVRAYFSDQPPRTVKDLSAPRRVLALRVRAGDISGGHSPFFEQFFAGGADSIRGYDEDRFWGKDMLIGTLEYRYPLQKSMNLIAFGDYGDAWGGYGSVGSFTQSSSFAGHLGYGLGLSFRTPLGPIRLDLGFDEHGKSRTHFQIGTSF